LHFADKSHGLPAILCRIQLLIGLLTGFAQQVFRKLNAYTVPLIVGVPKNAEEDAKKGNQ
jgi:hypothetical protein